MPINPFEMFDIGQTIGKNKKSSLLRSADYAVGEYGKTQDAIRKSKIGDEARADYYRARAEEIRNPQMQSKRGIYLVNPITGAPEQSGSVPKNARIFKQETPSSAEATTLSDVDEVLNTLPSVKSQLSKNPKLAMTGKVPFVNPGYKADYQYLTKSLAAVVGGKNLTLPERQIVQTNLPSYEDMFDQATLQKKLDRIERVMLGVKSRMATGTFRNSMNPIQQNAQAQSQPKIDQRARYNQLREQGLSNEEARKELGL